MRFSPAMCISAALTVAALPAMAQKLSCYEDPHTSARTCYSPSKIKETKGIRHSPLYVGGPNRLHETGMSIHVNCKTGVVHLKDRDGVSFAGGSGTETTAVSSLKRWICEENILKK